MMPQAESKQQQLANTASSGRGGSGAPMTASEVARAYYSGAGRGWADWRGLSSSDVHHNTIICMLWDVRLAMQLVRQAAGAGQALRAWLATPTPPPPPPPPTAAWNDKRMDDVLSLMAPDVVYEDLIYEVQCWGPAAPPQGGAASG